MSTGLCTFCVHPLACHSVGCTHPGCSCACVYLRTQPIAPLIVEMPEGRACLGYSGSEPINNAWADYDASLNVYERLALLERAIEQLVQGEIRRELAGLQALVEVLRGQAANYQDRLERLERPVDSRDAIVWEIGHAAALRGDAMHTNPFRKNPPQ